MNGWDTMAEAVGVVKNTDLLAGLWLDKMAKMCSSGNGIPALRGLGYEPALMLSQYALGEIDGKCQTD